MSDLLFAPVALTMGIENMVGGSESVEEDRDESIVGGMSVADYLRKRQPLSDSKSYTFFSDLVVPVGLLYQPAREETNLSEEDELDEISHCEKFERLFQLTAKDLGKSNTARKTRKKIA